MFDQLKQQFLASFEVKISNLNKALENHDTQALTLAVHQLAGSSGSYGFADISALCSEIECLMHEHDTDAKIQEKTRQLIKLMADQLEFTE